MMNAPQSSELDVNELLEQFYKDKPVPEDEAKIGQNFQNEINRLQNTLNSGSASVLFKTAESLIKTGMELMNAVEDKPELMQQVAEGLGQQMEKAFSALPEKDKKSLNGTKDFEMPSMPNSEDGDTPGLGDMLKFALKALQMLLVAGATLVGGPVAGEAMHEMTSKMMEPAFEYIDNMRLSSSGPSNTMTEDVGKLLDNGMEKFGNTEESDSKAEKAASSEIGIDLDKPLKLLDKLEEHNGEKDNPKKLSDSEQKSVKNFEQAYSKMQDSMKGKSLFNKLSSVKNLVKAGMEMGNACMGNEKLMKGITKELSTIMPKGSGLEMDTPAPKQKKKKSKGNDQDTEMIELLEKLMQILKKLAALLVAALVTALTGNPALGAMAGKATSMLIDEGFNALKRPSSKSGKFEISFQDLGDAFGDNFTDSLKDKVSDILSPKSKKGGPGQKGDIDLSKMSLSEMYKVAKVVVKEVTKEFKKTKDLQATMEDPLLTNPSSTSNMSLDKSDSMKLSPSFSNKDKDKLSQKQEQSMSAQSSTIDKYKAEFTPFNEGQKRYEKETKKAKEQETKQTQDQSSKPRSPGMGMRNT